MVLAGRYELTDIIGRGGHGTVWRAHDRNTGRAVAVKMLNDVAANDPNLIERLKREQLALVSLAGTSAVEFIDLCRTPTGKLGLVMELLEGIDLEQRLEDLEQQGQRIEVSELLHLLSPIIDTLERAHQAGILHRDLKPANIYIMNAAAGAGVRLLDFGLARMRSAQPLTAAGMIVGSPSYIAPEVWKGRPDRLDQRVDVYSFGVCVFRALANRLPFEGSTLQEKFRMTTTAPRPKIKGLRPDLPTDMDDWVEQVLAIDPDERFFTIRGAWNALLVSIRSEDFADNVATASDLASAAGSMAPLEPISTASPQLAPDRSLVSDWLSKSHYSVDPPPAPPPSSVRSTPVSSGAVMVAKVVPVAGDPTQRVDDKRSFVREWLAGSDLTVPDQNSDDQNSDVASWLGVTEDEPPAESRSHKPAPKPPRPPRRPTPPPPKPEPEPQAEAPVAVSEVTQPSVALEAAAPKSKRTRAAKPKKAPAKKTARPKPKRKRKSSRRKRKK
jgi:serine/threonine-protein kinase